MNITIHRAGQNYGPFTQQQLNKHLLNKIFNENDLAWYDGCTEWKTIREFLLHQNIPPFYPPIKQTPPKKNNLLKSCLTIIGALVIGWIALITIVSILIAASPEKTKSSTVTTQSSPPTNTVISDPISVPIKPSIEISNISWDEISTIYGLNSNYTDIQKDEHWKKYKGRYIKWNGTVSEISKNWGTYTLQVKMNPDTIGADLIIYLKDTQKDKALSLSVGQSVTFIGEMDEWGTLLPITLRDGELQ